MADHSENSKPKMASPPVGSLLRVYAHGIYDLFNSGHAASLEQAKKSFPNTFLVVGCCNDEVAHKYKGKPVMTAAERYESLRCCKWVDEVIPDAPWVIDLDFLDKHCIDHLAHDALHDALPFADKMDVPKLHDSDDKKEEEAVLSRFRHHLADEELVALYLRRKVVKKPHLVERIKEIIDIYKYDARNNLNSAFQENSISLKSSDNVVLKMNKRAATSQSKVLRDVVDSTGGRDEISVLGVTGLILSKITPFCKKIHKFNTQLSIIAELLKCTMDSYKAFVTSFVKDNHSIFSQLHDAANYLNIPNLMELTSRTIRDMKKGSTIEEISDRHSTLSIARILSPLGLNLKYSS